MEYWFMAAVVACLLFVVISQQRMIDRLNDRLMARSYGEYKAPKEEDASTQKEDEPKSWYDQ